MSLVIDGYNLAYEVGWLTRRQRGGNALERARTGLLNFVVHSLDEQEAASTTVVFDASRLPEGVSAQQSHGKLTVLFAENYDDADALIEELIQRCGSPKQLTVVSSDRRIISAAKRRKATPLKSGEWYDRVIQDRRTRSPKPEVPEELAKKRGKVIPPSELEYWLSEFS